MSEPIRPGSPNAPRPIDGAAGKSVARATGGRELRPAFEALLQGLEQKARELAAASDGVEAPADLAEAVHRAGDSLQEALSIRDRIVEAYRESLTRPEAPERRAAPGEEEPEQGSAR